MLNALGSGDNNSPYLLAQGKFSAGILSNFGVHIFSVSSVFSPGLLRNEEQKAI